MTSNFKNCIVLLNCSLPVFLKSKYKVNPGAHFLPEAVLLKGLLGDRTGWAQLAVELKGFGKSESEREKSVVMCLSLAQIVLWIQSLFWLNYCEFADVSISEIF